MGQHALACVLPAAMSRRVPQSVSCSILCKMMQPSFAQCVCLLVKPPLLADTLWTTRLFRLSRSTACAAQRAVRRGHHLHARALAHRHQAVCVGWGEVKRGGRHCATSLTWTSIRSCTQPGSVYRCTSKARARLARGCCCARGPLPLAAGGPAAAAGGWPECGRPKTSCIACTPTAWMTDAAAAWSLSDEPVTWRQSRRERRAAAGTPQKQVGTGFNGEAAMAAETGRTQAQDAGAKTSSSGSTCKVHDLLPARLPVMAARPCLLVPGRVLACAGGSPAPLP